MGQRRENRHWFGPKRFGWGARPTSWQGWMVTAAFVVVLGLSHFAAAPFMDDLPGTQTLAISLGITAICVGALLAIVKATYGRDD